MTRRRLTIVLLVLLALAALLGAAWIAAGLTPSWYAPADPTDARIEHTSERLEFRIQQELHRIRKDEPRWTLRVPDHVINDWLATRLKPWMRGQEIDWPQGTGTPQIRCRSGIIEVAIPLADLQGRIGRIDLHPVIDSGGLQLEPGGCSLGRLPVGLPGSLVMPDLGDTPLLTSPMPALLELVDDRSVKIVAIRPGTGGLDVDFVTLPPSVP